jgi:DNA invertase Pin-like site-specific DNA recombinase
LKAKLTAEQVAEIARAYMASGVSVGEMSRKYGLHRSTLQRLVNGESWQHVTGPLGLKPRAVGDYATVRGSDSVHAKLDADKVRRARQLHKEGVPYSSIAELSGVSISTIKRAISGLNWKHV